MNPRHSAETLGHQKSALDFANRALVNEKTILKNNGRDLDVSVTSSNYSNNIFLTTFQITQQILGTASRRVSATWIQ